MAFKRIDPAVGALSAAAVICVSASSRRAAAYTYESPVSHACHELLAWDTLRAARELDELDGVAAPLAVTEEDARLRDSIAFTLPDDLRDPAAVALALGVRDNDIKETSGIDLEELATLHGDPAAQAEHCLRRPEHDFEAGSPRALDDCKQYIRDKVRTAVRDGLDAGGRPDPTRRATLDTHLPFAGATQVEVPLFYATMGQALHAVQDSFTHTFRLPITEGAEDGVFELSLPDVDRTRVTVVLNWVEFAENNLDEPRDGPAHMTELDDCRADDDLRVRRRNEALWASIDLLRAALHPDLDEDHKAAAVDAVLDGYLGYAPGCTFDNDWCDAREEALRSDGCGCRMVSPARTRGAGWLLALLFVGRARRRSSRSRATAGLAAALAVIDCPKEAYAEDKEEERRGLERSPVGVHASFAGAIDDWALAASIGPRFRVPHHWLLGCDLEWNPWLSVEDQRFTPGALNAYASVIKRWPVEGPIDLRTSIHVGASVLLFDVYGAELGSVGPFLGARPLGVEVPLSASLTLVIEPLDAALAVPHVTGAPLVYGQYRVAIGIQWGT